PRTQGQKSQQRSQPDHAETTAKALTPHHRSSLPRHKPAPLSLGSNSRAPLRSFHTRTAWYAGLTTSQRSFSPNEKSSSRRISSESTADHFTSPASAPTHDERLGTNPIEFKPRRSASARARNSRSVPSFECSTTASGAYAFAKPAASRSRPSS